MMRKAKSEERVLLRRPLWPHGKKLAQLTQRNLAGRAVNMKQRSLRRQKISDLRNQFDHAVVPLSDGQQAVFIEGLQDTGVVRVVDRRWVWQVVDDGRIGSTYAWPGEPMRVKGLNQLPLFLADARQNREGPDQASHAIDHIQEHRDAQQTAVGADSHGNLRHRVTHMSDHRQRQREEEDDDHQGDFEAAVGQGPADDPRCELHARQLHDHQQRRKQKDDERQLRRQQHAQQRSSRIDVQVRPSHGDSAIQCSQQVRRDDAKDHRHHGTEP